ncbi:hypothetical protein [Streptosporangium vulgare]|uniref:Uncharacterized protein n=1 Tax=Streptosporangium vulgare TaxID=46190 RepID=A0ABV5TB25_9ACTN
MSKGSGHRFGQESEDEAVRTVLGGPAGHVFGIGERGSSAVPRAAPRPAPVAEPI